MSDTAFLPCIWIHGCAQYTGSAGGCHPAMPIGMYVYRFLPVAVDVDVLPISELLTVVVVRAESLSALGDGPVTGGAAVSG